MSGLGSSACPEPRLETSEHRGATATPQATRRDLDERQQVRHAVRDGVRVVGGPHRCQQRAQLRLGPGPLVDELGGHCQHGVHVEAHELAAEWAAGAEAPLRHGLDQRPPGQEVACRREVERGPVERAADGRAPLQHPRQRQRIEVHGCATRVRRTDRRGPAPASARGARRPPRRVARPARGASGARATRG